jgi:hypothetical protein
VPGALVSGKRASWVLLKASIMDTSGHDLLAPGNFYP